MKYTIIGFILSELIYAGLVWVSGWEPARGEKAIMVLIMAGLFGLLGGMFGAVKDSIR